MKNIFKSPERIKREYENHKKYRDKNRKKLNAKSVEFYAQNRDLVATRKAKNRRDNIEECLKKEQIYREKNRDRINDLMNQRRRELRIKCFDYLGGSICCLCGFTSQFTSQFDFHHCRGGTKDFCVGNAVGHAYKWKRIQSELDKCVVLCRNCHMLITSSDWKMDIFPTVIKNKIIKLNLVPYEK